MAKILVVDDSPLNRELTAAFLRPAEHEVIDAAIAQSIASLAHNLALNVVAEGVETLEQLQYLASVGCNERQGYYFSRPVSRTGCTRRLLEDRRMSAATAPSAAASGRF